jgi:hypothetical protein
MEDFVPYELAIKLEQKGFKQGYNIFGFKPIFSNETTIRFISNIGAYYNEYFGENIAAPTISQVLKWLRKEKKIYIMIDRSFSVKNSWHYIICNNDDFEHLNQQESIPNRKWEQAALDGIEYVLDNLI